MHSKLLYDQIVDSECVISANIDVISWYRLLCLILAASPFFRKADLEGLEPAWVSLSQDCQPSK